MTDAMGFITAGGKSSRMGRDKAWLELGGQLMIERVIAALAPVTTSLAIIANTPEYSRFGLPVFADSQPNVGPLEAIRTALANARTSRVVLAGCDLPFLTTELFEFLLSIPSDHSAIVPVGIDGKLEPLCAVYSQRVLPVVDDLIRSGKRKVSILFDRIDTRLIPFDELSSLPGARLFFENVNTPEDYRRAVETASELKSLS